MKFYRFACALALLFAGTVNAQVYNRFGPANGILVGQTTTYQTTAATAADAISLWSGTCNASTFLRGDGSCATATTTPAGANTQVQYNNSGVFGASSAFIYNGTTLNLTTPSGLNPGVTVTGNAAGAPIYEWYDASVAANGRRWWMLSSGSFQLFAVDDAGTPGQIGLQIDRTAGTSNISRSWLIAGGTSSLSISAAGDFRVNGSAGTAGQFLKSAGSGAATTWASLDAADIASGTFGVTRGGTGAATLSGVLKGNGTGAIGSAASSDVISLWSGTCNSTTFLRADGSCQTVTAAPAGSNTYVQYNASGVFGAEAAFNYNATTDVLTVPGYAGGDGNISGTWQAGTVAATSTMTVAGQDVRNTALFTAGTLGVTRGGTGTTTSTGSGNVVLSASPTLTGTTTAATIAATTITVGGNNVCQSTGTNCPASGGNAAYAVIAVGGAACSVSGSYDSSGVASCTYNAAGSYNVNLSTGTGTNPTCVVTLFGTATAAKIATVNGVDADTMGVGIYQLTSAGPITWTASDNSFSIHCNST